jgi:hypothetical protein
MKILKHNLIIALLLGTATLFSQNRKQNSSESFTVKNDVIVEINTRNTEVTVEHWNKNEVLVETVIEVEGLTVEESQVLFDSWEIEVMGNSSRVVITSHPKFSNEKMDFTHDIDFNFDLDLNFEPVIAYSFHFNSDSFPSPPEMPKIVIDKLHNMEWDQKAYEKDKDGYLMQWEKNQEKWAKEIEEKFEPMMEEYEKEMEKWEEEFSKKYEPKMEEYEKKMEKWEKEMEPKLRAKEKKLAKIEREIKVKVVKVEREIGHQQENSKKVKTTILIKIPKNASVDVDAHNDKIQLPKNVKTL